MSYNSNIPQAAERLKDSQPELLENFKCISALLGVNHVIDPWTSPATGDEGKHNFLQMPVQGSDPSTGATELALFTKLISGSPHLFIRPKNNGTAFDISSITPESAADVDTTSFKLTSGVIIKIGSTSGGKLVGDASTQINFPTAFPSSCYGVVVTKIAIADTDQLGMIWIVGGSITRFKFNVFNRKSTAGALDCTFIAMGI